MDRGLDAFRRKHHRSEEESAEHMTHTDGQWAWEKGTYGWEAKLLPPLPRDDSRFEEKDRRDQVFLQMLRDQREEKERITEHNEGFLRDHPDYKDLFIKWALRYLRQNGSHLDHYNGEVSDSGYMLDTEGNETRDKLVNLVAPGREVIDENIAYELWHSEHFEDITRDYDRREELDVHPENDGWWNEDEW